MTEIPEPIEDIDFFIIKRVRYELHVEGTMFMTADEECDDLPIGMVTDARVGLLCGIYGSLMEYPCDVCGEDCDAQAYNGMVLCGDCLDAERAKEAT